MSVVTSGFRVVSSPPSLKTPEVALGFGVSLIAPLYFGLVSYFHGASGPIIQDDARLHIVWLQRLVDSALFPDDLIANYYAAIQPAGFKALYGMASVLGIDPLGLAKIAPIGLALIATIYLFWVSLLLLPAPLSGVLTTLVFNQNVWLKDDLISATPRAFVYPIFAAFLYYLLRGSRVSCLIALGLQGLFYPQMMLVSVGVLTLRLLSRHRMSRDSSLRDREGNSRFGRRFSPVLFWLAALCLTGLVLLTFSGQVADQVGRLVTLEEMKAMPEFQVDGRRPYFGVSPLQFIFGGASGLRFPLFPPVILAGGLLPFIKRRTEFTLASQLTQDVDILKHLLMSAMGLFLLAHLVFPTLYLPSRFTFYSFRFLLAIASGLVLTLVVHRVWGWLDKRRRTVIRWTLQDRLKVAFAGLLAMCVVITPAVPALFLPCQGWVRGQAPGIYAMLADSPKDTLVASLTDEANNAPAFSQRSVLLGEEFALPYHVNFYASMTQRMKDMVQAQYSARLDSVQAFIQTYGVDVWIVDQQFAEPNYLIQQKWLLNSSIRDTVTDVLHSLQQGTQPALTGALPPCSTFTENQLIVLDAHCISRLEPES